MQQQLPRRQAIALGATVLTALGLAAFGLTQVGSKQGLFAETFEVRVGFAEAHDIRPGTIVRLRGLDAGQVTALDYPESDEPSSTVTVRMQLDTRFQRRLYADASAEVHSTSLLGAKVIAITPGTPEAGAFVGPHLKATVAPSLAEAAAKLGEAADEAKQLIHEARTGPGTIGRLMRDDELYQDFKGLVQDSRTQVQKLDGFVAEGRTTLQSIKKSSDAVTSLPLIRSYVPTDGLARLTRPDWDRETHTYTASDLFEPGSAILTAAGQQHTQAEAEWLKTITNDAAELVVAATVDPKESSWDDSTARALTQLRAEAVVTFLKDAKAHRLGWVSSRTLLPLGLGRGRLPGAATDSPAAAIVFLLFTPR